jgi:hypothetical protein
VLITQISLVIKLNSATNVFGSNLFGTNTGMGAKNVTYYSNFMGENAGRER